MTIPAEFFLCVTGDPRSGTSLMMRTLDALGVPVAGELFPGTNASPGDLVQPEKARSQLQERRLRKLDRMKKMNPHGFYEVVREGVIRRGVRNKEQLERLELGGKAVKVISQGAHPRPRSVGTDPSLVWKWVWCIRDVAAVAESQGDLDDGIEVPGEDTWEHPKSPANPLRYLMNNGGLAKFFDEHDDLLPDLIVVDYDMYVNDPEATVDALVEQLGLQPTAEQREAAYNVVDVSLNRSSEKFTDWKPEVLQMAETATELYEAIVEGDFPRAAMAADAGEGLLEVERKRRTKYYDPATGAFGDFHLHTRLIQDAEYRAAHVARQKRMWLAGFHPECSAEFSYLKTPDPYDVDLGFATITRSRVQYRGEVVTWEQAWHAHQQLLTQPGREGVTLRPHAERLQLMKERTDAR